MADARPHLQEEILADLLRTRLVMPSRVPGVLAEVGGYELLRQLGVGSMGAVFLGRSARSPKGPGDSSLVVVKLLKPFFLTKPSFQQRFVREAVRLSRLSHPHLLPVLKFHPIPTPRLTRFCWPRAAPRAAVRSSARPRPIS
jgi:serine/threonine protein kinase